MSPIHEAKARVRQAYRASGFVTVTATMLPLFLAHQRRVPESDQDLVRELWVRRWARGLLRLFQIETRISGQVPPPSQRGERGRLIVCNHRSAIDVGVLLATFGGTMVSRADLGNWPVVGAAARAVGTVLVDRSSAQSGAATIRIMQQHLEQGRTITVFPEGTTFAGDEVRTFHPGAFVAAVRAQADILPVGLAYPSASGAAFVDETFLRHLGRMSMSEATVMGLSVGTPIRSVGMRAAALTARAHASVTDLVQIARGLCGP